MISNLDDLDAAAEIVPREAMEPIDRLACNVADAFVASVKAAYDRCQIHDAYLRIVEFESASVEPLLRCAQGSALLARGQRPAAPQRAVGAALRAQAVPDRARAGALVYGRRSVAGVAAGASRRCRERSSTNLSTSAHHRSGAFESDLATLAAAARVARARRGRRRAARFRGAAASRSHAGRVQALARAGRQSARGAGRFAACAWCRARATPSRRRRSSRSSCFRREGEKCVRCWKYRQLGTDPAHPAICADCARSRPIVRRQRLRSGPRRRGSAPSRRIRSRRARRASARYEVEVVIREQPRAEHLLRAEEMREVGTRSRRAGRAIAARIERRDVAHEGRVEDIELAVVRHRAAVAAAARRIDRIEKVDAGSRSLRLGRAPFRRP